MNCYLLLSLLFVGFVSSKLIVHPTHSADDIPSIPRHEFDLKRGIKQVSSSYHVDAHLLDLTKNVVEIPEQTVPLRHALPVVDLEEDQNDVTNLIKEIPEQSISDERASQNNENENENDQPKFPAKDFERADGDDSQNELEEFTNPFLKNHRDPIHPLEKTRNRLSSPVSELKTDAHDIDVLTSGYHFHIQEKQNRNFFDANRVQIGTSVLGAHSGAPDEHGHAVVAQYRIKFFQHFQYRPIVLVTTVPASAEDKSSMGPHTDVFVASVNEIRLDSFVVSIVRVDQYPNNGWGQDLLLDWVAIEYTTNFPHAGPALTESTIPLKPIIDDHVRHDSHTNKAKLHHESV